MSARGIGIMGAWLAVAGVLAASPQPVDGVNPVIWLHYDYMIGADGHSDAPDPAAMQIVVDAFEAHGISLRIDPQHTAIPARSAIVPDWPYYLSAGFEDASCTGPDAVRFSDLRQQYFEPRSNHDWHYAVFGDYVFGDPQHVENCPHLADMGFVNGVSVPPLPGMTGFSQVGFFHVWGGFGYNLVVALQGARAAGLDMWNAATRARFEAAVVMHELGHNLGLCHSGPSLPDRSCLAGSWGHNPNYISVMNPTFNFGIPYAAEPGATVAAGVRVDYSDVQLPDLDEANLDEAVGLQDFAHPTDLTRPYSRPFVPVVGPVDWDRDGRVDETGIQNDLNGDQMFGVLHGADDWAWIHNRLLPPSISGFSAANPQAQEIHAGDGIVITGVNLIAPATVIFAGGASATTPMLGPLTCCISWDLTPVTNLAVIVPDGARSGPFTVVTPQGRATSRESLTIAR